MHVCSSTICHANYFSAYEYVNVAKVRCLVRKFDKYLMVFDKAAKDFTSYEYFKASPKQRLQAMLELSKAVASVHDNDLVHGNLMPSRIYFNSATCPVIYGFVNANTSETQTIQRTAYSAPEPNVTQKFDIYSLGKLFEVISKSSSNPKLAELIKTMVRSNLQKTKPKLDDIVQFDDVTPDYIYARPNIHQVVHELQTMVQSEQ